jgi:hypothetical protein
LVSVSFPDSVLLDTIAAVESSLFDDVTRLQMILQNIIDVYNGYSNPQLENMCNGKLYRQKIGLTL